MLPLRRPLVTRGLPKLKNPLPGIRPHRVPGSISFQFCALTMAATMHPLAGLYKPNPLQALYYGPLVVKDHLLSCLPSSSSKAFIITGSSLATKTPLIKQVEELLGTEHHAGTFSNIKEHAPAAQLDQAAALVEQDPSIDTIISVGGGSPIDSAKVISFRVNEKSGKFLTHIAVPTTLSAAECTAIAGYTKEDGVKTGLMHPKVYPSSILYDASFGLYTPQQLFLSTAIRALDHAVESQYHPNATWMPCRLIALSAIQELFHWLPVYQRNPKDQDAITRLFLAAFASLGFLGQNIKSSLGLSHTLGYALGSPYGIPHGVTSCLTLGHVVKLKAEASEEDADRIAGILPYIGEQRSGDNVRDAERVGDRILGLVKDLGLKTTLTEKGVGRDQLDIICTRALGGLLPTKDISPEDAKKLATLRRLVEGLY